MLDVVRICRRRQPALDDGLYVDFNTSPMNMTAKFPHITPSLRGGIPTGPNAIGGMASSRVVVAMMEMAGGGVRKWAGIGVSAG